MTRLSFPLALHLMRWFRGTPTVCHMPENLTPDSVKPNQLQQHLETTHSSYVNKPLDFFKTKFQD